MKKIIFFCIFFIPLFIVMEFGGTMAAFLVLGVLFDIHQTFPAELVLKVLAVVMIPVAIYTAQHVVSELMKNKSVRAKNQ